MGIKCTEFLITCETDLDRSNKKIYNKLRFTDEITNTTDLLHM